MQRVSRGEGRVHIPVYRRQSDHLYLRWIERHKYRHRIILSRNTNMQNAQITV